MHASTHSYSPGGSVTYQGVELKVIALNLELSIAESTHAVLLVLQSRGKAGHQFIVHAPCMGIAKAIVPQLSSQTAQQLQTGFAFKAVIILLQSRQQPLLLFCSKLQLIIPRSQAGKHILQLAASLHEVGIQPVLPVYVSPGLFVGNQRLLAGFAQLLCQAQRLLAHGCLAGKPSLHNCRVLLQRGQRIQRIHIFNNRTLLTLNSYRPKGIVRSFIRPQPIVAHDFFICYSSTSTDGGQKVGQPATAGVGISEAETN